MLEGMESVPEDDLGIPVEWRSIECVDAIAIRLDQRAARCLRRVTYRRASLVVRRGVVPEL